MTSYRSNLFAALSFSAVLSPALAQVSHVPPSNTQLANPQIERKVDALLKQMTLDEKIGQLVQYSATEAHPAPTPGNTTTALNVNPPAHSAAFWSRRHPWIPDHLSGPLGHCIQLGSRADYRSGAHGCPRSPHR